MANVLQNTQQLPGTDILKSGNANFQVPADIVMATSNPVQRSKIGNPISTMFLGQQAISRHLAFKFQKLLTGQTSLMTTHK
jgi:hypothetical protein